jgi:hypothetical protein
MKYQRILEIKRRTSAEDLCAGLPGQFAQYFRKVRRLRFAEEPAYAEYREMFRGLFIEMGFVYDSVYDWSSLPPLRLPIPKHLSDSPEQPLPPEMVPGLPHPS